FKGCLDADKPRLFFIVMDLGRKTPRNEIAQYGGEIIYADHSSGCVVNARGKRFHGHIHDLPDPELGILLDGAATTGTVKRSHLAHYFFFGQVSADQGCQWHSLHHKIPDSIVNLYDGVSFSRKVSEGVVAYRLNVT